MKKLAALLIMLTSVVSFADVCQIKPSGHLDDNLHSSDINLWSLKKGDVILSDYTHFDQDVTAAVIQRNYLITEGLCQKEPVLEKCSVSLEDQTDSQGVKHFFVVVSIGSKKALALGGLTSVDNYSIDLARQKVDFLTAAEICTRH